MDTSEPTLVSAAPPMAATLSGRRYLVAENSLGLISLSFSFDETAEARLEIETVDRKVSVSIGLDGVFRISPRLTDRDPQTTTFDFPSALKGYWVTDNVFTIHWNEIGNINDWIIQCLFDGPDLTMSFTETIYDVPVPDIAATQE